MVVRSVDGKVASSAVTVTVGPPSRLWVASYSSPSRSRRSFSGPDPFSSSGGGSDGAASFPDGGGRRAELH
jgi:hypothetical protein